jgi:hypothetical protein
MGLQFANRLSSTLEKGNKSGLQKCRKQGKSKQSQMFGRASLQVACDYSLDSLRKNNAGREFVNTQGFKPSPCNSIEFSSYCSTAVQTAPKPCTMLECGECWYNVSGSNRQTRDLPSRHITDSLDLWVVLQC